MPGEVAPGQLPERHVTIRFGCGWEPLLDEHEGLLLAERPDRVRNRTCTSALTVRVRSGGLRASDVDDALNSGELVTTWVNRGALHLIRFEDYPWLHALTTPQLAASNATRLRQEGVSPEQADRAYASCKRSWGPGREPGCS